MVHQLGYSKTTFDTQGIGSTGMIGQTSDDPVILHEEVDLAAGAAERTGGGNLTLWFSIPLAGLLRKRAGRANLQAGAAKAAAGLQMRAPKSRTYHRICT